MSNSNCMLRVMPNTPEHPVTMVYTNKRVAPPDLSPADPQVEYDKMVEKLALLALRLKIKQGREQLGMARAEKVSAEEFLKQKRILF
jgi:hypothetical protein